jgi:hypothetical protein
MTAARIVRRKAHRHPRRSSASADPARPCRPSPSSRPATKQQLDSLFAAPKTAAYPSTNQHRHLLHPKSIILTVPLEANSP